MTKKRLYIILIILLPVMAKADISLPLIFGDHMVLQRDKEVLFWGNAGANEQISMTFRGSVRYTRADESGRWKMSLPPQQAGGPYDIVFKGRNSIILRDILFGDVWLCGGQSNMQFRINELTKAAKDTLPEEIKNIRIFTVGLSIDYVPKEEIASGKWVIADRNTIQDFSAVAFFFGKYVQDSIRVPIGLISSNLGATSVEQWMSAAAISAFPQFDTYYETYLEPQRSFVQVDSAFYRVKQRWEEDYYLKDDPGLEEKWYLPSTDISTWREMKIPSFWEDEGLPDFDGSVWFRRNFDLKDSDDRVNFKLSIGAANNYNIVWVNGIKIGEGFGSENWNSYPVADSILKEKGNIVVARVFDAGGKGGMYNMFWDQRLAGTWHFQIGKRIYPANFKKPVVVNANLFGSPSILFNGCIAPLRSFAIKGVIWYQGEANAERAYEYRALFPAMIHDWRKQFNDPSLPFVFVQLAGYNAGTGGHGQSAWAELREAQSMALSLPFTGMAVAIDIGEADDIHPKNKIDVGKRLAIAALNAAYGRNNEQSPLFDRSEKRNDSILIFFKPDSGKLVSANNSDSLTGFLIAGSDRKFYRAQACIQDNHVVVYHPQIKFPVSVRYAWSDATANLNLYNDSGLPAAPFRTDDWEGITRTKVFEFIE